MFVILFHVLQNNAHRLAERPNDNKLSASENKTTYITTDEKRNV